MSLVTYINTLNISYLDTKLKCKHLKHRLKTPIKLLVINSLHIHFISFVYLSISDVTSFHFCMNLHSVFHLLMYMIVLIVRSSYYFQKSVALDSFWLLNFKLHIITSLSPSCSFFNLCSGLSLVPLGNSRLLFFNCYCYTYKYTLICKCMTF